MHLQDHPRVIRQAAPEAGAFQDRCHSPAPAKMCRRTAFALVALLPPDRLCGLVQRGFHRRPFANDNPGVHPCSGLDTVQQANLERVHAEFARKVVHLRLVNERRLGRTESAERTTDRIVRAHSNFLDLEVLDLVRPADELTALVQDFVCCVGVWAGVGDYSRFYRNDLAILRGGGRAFDDHRVTLHVREDRFPALANEAYGSPGYICQ